MKVSVKRNSKKSWQA